MIGGKYNRDWPFIGAVVTLFAAAALFVASPSLEPRRSPRTFAAVTPAIEHAASGHAHVESRSPHWPAVRRQHIEREPACAVCGHTGAGLEVHHLLPFREHPELECVDSNLMTVCGDEGRCHAHYWLCHAGNFRGWNADAREDAKLMRSRWMRSAELAKEPSK